MNLSASGYRFREAKFDELEGWTADDPTPLFPALRNCIDHIRSVKPYRKGALGLSAEDLVSIAEALPHSLPDSPAAARSFFEQHFQPFFIEEANGSKGLVTAFYEPEIAVSAMPDTEFKYPIYARPADLVDIDDNQAAEHLQPGYRFARSNDGRLEPYPDRRSIDLGYLEGKGLELAWAKSKVDLFFVHIQGAARLRFPDGTISRITYSAKAGHPFSAIGKLLVDRGQIPASEISMQSIRKWLAEHPDEVDEVLWHNRSYIFFKEVEVGDLTSGPIAAAKVPLVAGRSLAVDREIHTFGFPFFVHSKTLTHLDDGHPFGRLMLALDTGSAIVGPARGDIFTGSGFAAGELAGTVRNAADFYILIPKSVAKRYR